MVAWTKAVEWNLGYMLKVELGRLASKLDEKVKGKGFKRSAGILVWVTSLMVVVSFTEMWQIRKVINTFGKKNQD